MLVRAASRFRLPIALFLAPLLPLAGPGTSLASAAEAGFPGHAALPGGAGRTWSDIRPSAEDADLALSKTLFSGSSDVGLDLTSDGTPKRADPGSPIGAGLMGFGTLMGIVGGLGLVSMYAAQEPYYQGAKPWDYSYLGVAWVALAVAGVALICTGGATLILTAE